jgi:hypothetical protein
MKLIAQSVKRKYPWHFIEAQWFGNESTLVQTFFHYSKKPPSCEAKGPLKGARKINLMSFETKQEREKFRLETTFDLPADMKMEPVRPKILPTAAETQATNTNENTNTR